MSVIETVDTLREVFESGEKGVFTVKPRVIFSIIETQNSEPIEMNLQIPSSGIGSITMLEASILISLLKTTNPS